MHTTTTPCPPGTTVYVAPDPGGDELSTVRAVVSGWEDWARYYTLLAAGGRVLMCVGPDSVFPSEADAVADRKRQAGWVANEARERLAKAEAYLGRP